MSGYELYNKVLEALNMDEGTFNAAARNWIEGTENVVFENQEATELYNMAKIACAAWRNKAINGRVSKIRMINCVRKIAEMNLPNPHPVETHEYGVNPENIKLPDEPEAIQGSTVKDFEQTKIYEPIHILGIVREEDRPEEKKEEKPKFFNKRKNR